MSGVLQLLVSDPLVLRPEVFVHFHSSLPGLVERALVLLEPLLLHPQSCFQVVRSGGHHVVRLSLVAVGAQAGRQVSSHRVPLGLMTLQVPELLESGRYLGEVPCQVTSLDRLEVIPL